MGRLQNAPLLLVTGIAVAEFVVILSLLQSCGICQVQPPEQRIPPTVRCNSATEQDTVDAPSPLDGSAGLLSLPRQSQHPISTDLAPIVIFSALRVRDPEWSIFSRALASWKTAFEREVAETGTLRRCLFVLHTDPGRQKENRQQLQMLRSIKFCAVRVWRIPKSGQPSALVLRDHWLAVQKQLWTKPEILDMPDGKQWLRDVLFIEDDCCVAPDLATVERAALFAKNGGGHGSVHAVSFGGWSGENTINAHPKTLITRRSHEHLLGLVLSFNQTFAQELYADSYWSKCPSPDWTECVGFVIIDLKIVVPTLSRVWHIGNVGLGPSGEGGERPVEKFPPWHPAEDALLQFDDAMIFNPKMRGILGYTCDNAEQGYAQWPMDVATLDERQHRMDFTFLPGGHLNATIDGWTFTFPLYMFRQCEVEDEKHCIITLGGLMGLPSTVFSGDVSVSNLRFERIDKVFALERDDATRAVSIPTSATRGAVSSFSLLMRGSRADEGRVLFSLQAGVGKVPFFAVVARQDSVFFQFNQLYVFCAWGDLFPPSKRFSIVCDKSIPTDDLCFEAP
eukprot:m.207418 g.207418  ORF g.207418 m.207418 type:complete len:565 (-) comp10710_c0_seq2:2279-3973(-)